ncbi:unnamed protein product, partial [Brassica napus]
DCFCEEKRIFRAIGVFSVFLFSRLLLSVAKGSGDETEGYKSASHGEVSLRQDYSQLAAETGLKRRTSWESISLSSPQSLILFVNPQAKVSCFGISLDRLNMFSAVSLISLC